VKQEELMNAKNELNGTLKWKQVNGNIRKKKKKKLDMYRKVVYEILPSEIFKSEEQEKVWTVFITRKRTKHLL
jgi:hypothetical protein